MRVPTQRRQRLLSTRQQPTRACSCIDSPICISTFLPSREFKPKTSIEAAFRVAKSGRIEIAPATAGSLTMLIKRIPMNVTEVEAMLVRVSRKLCDVQRCAGGLAKI